MQKIALAVAAAALIAGPLASAQVAQAASATTPTTNVSTPAPVQGPKTLMLDCQGTTGSMGCGPGWVWHDGWRGWACYPC
jgi:hypothetical protein